MTGCINIKVYNDCKPKHHESEESDEHGEDKEHHDGKCKHHEGKESEEREEKEGKESEAKLKAEAKISEADARATAMAKVPNGTIKEGELERENGKLQWSFDISTPGTKDITEVNINAVTGELIGVSKETPEDQAKEGDEDDKKEKN